VNKDTGIDTYENSCEKSVRGEHYSLLKNCPIPEEQVLSNLGLFLNSKNLSRILFMNELYRRIIEVQGVVLEFGTRWGQNLSLFAALRGIYEPFNRHRKIVGFDTFAGFPSVTPKDGESALMREGNLSVTEDYQLYLERVMQMQELDNPISHIRKFDLRKGDAVVELEHYLAENPETIVALAYFDFDLYEPTKRCLELIRPYLVKGSVLGFDELNDPDSPGETVALREVYGMNNIRLRRYQYASRVSYFTME